MLPRDKKGRFIKGIAYRKGFPCPDWLKEKISEANKGRPAWNKTNIILKCVVCGKKFRTIPSKMKKVCGIVCRNKFYSKRGKKSPNYKNGISLYRQFVIKKKCEDCNSTKFLLIHHIDGDRSNNNIRNLKVLCKRCHQILHGCINNLPN